MEAVLRTENLTKCYGSKFAANKVNMTVNRGDIYGFIGKNGAGKTTVMKIVTGVSFATSGSVELFGGEPLKSARKKLGCLIESPGFYRNCSAKENLKRMAIFSGDTDAKIDEILDLVGLGDVGRKKAGAFSLGMKQRLGIAIALLGDPEFLILDEPVNGLDPEGIKSIRDLVLFLNREKGITFLISSHLLDELAKIVTKYGIINDGLLVDEISAEELKSRTFDGLQIKVSGLDLTKAVEVLQSSDAPIKYKIENGSIFVTDGYSDSASINRMLVTAGVAVKELILHSGGLEEYFIERIG